MVNKETSKIPETQREEGKSTVEMQDPPIDQEAEAVNIAPRDGEDLQSDNTPVESTVAGTESQMTELSPPEESSQTSLVIEGDKHTLVESESAPESDNTPLESTKKLTNSDNPVIESLFAEDTSILEVAEIDTQNSALLPSEAQSSQDEAHSITGGSEPLTDTSTVVDTLVFPLESLLQESLCKFSSLESLLENLPAQLQQIENRLIVIEKNQHKEIENPGSKSMQEIEKLVQNACERDQASLNKDEQELKDYDNQVRHWKDIIKMLRREIISATQACYERIKECGKEMKELFLSFPDLQPLLQGRYEGLELIEKMLVRLQKPVDELSNDEILDLQLPTIGKQELIDFLNVQMSDKDAHQLIEKKLQDVENLRYQRIRKVRDLAEGLSKRCLNFIDKKVLPIVDGIDDGERYSKPLLKQLKNDNLNRESQLDAWFQTYSDLRKILLDALQTVGVQCIDVKAGEPIDYMRHEPFDIQQDLKLPNESIKEVTRHGYEYKDYDESQFKVLRHAQVVVVKN